MFGSFVRSEQAVNSDIDLLVEFEEGADLFDLIGLSLYLEEELQRKVDVVPKRALREELRESVLREVVAELTPEEVTASITVRQEEEKKKKGK